MTYPPTNSDRILPGTTRLVTAESPIGYRVLRLWADPLREGMTVLKSARSRRAANKYARSVAASTDESVDGWTPQP